MHDDLLGVLIGCGCKKACCCGKEEGVPTPRSSTLFQATPRTTSRPPQEDESPFIPPVQSYDSPQRPGHWGVPFTPYSEPARDAPAVFRHLPPGEAPSRPVSLPGEFQQADATTVPVPPALQQQVDLIAGASLTVRRLELERTVLRDFPVLAGGIPDFGDEYHPGFTAGRLTEDWGWFDVAVVYNRTQVLYLSAVGEGYGKRVRLTDGNTVQNVPIETSRWTEHLTTTLVQGHATTGVTPLGESVTTRSAVLRRYRVAVEMAGGGEHLAELIAVFDSGTSTALPSYTILASLPPEERRQGLEEQDPGQEKWVVLRTWVSGGGEWRPLEPEEQRGEFWNTAEFERGDPPTMDPLEPEAKWRDPGGVVTALAPVQRDLGGALTDLKLTAYGQAFVGGTWTALRDVDGAPLVLHESGGTVRAIRASGVESCTAAQFEARVLKCAPGSFLGFSPVGLGSHSWPPPWAWAVTRAEGRAVLPWDAWRDSTRREWPGRPRKRPPDSAPLDRLPSSLRPPLGLTLATTAPPPGREERLKRGQPPAHLPSVVEVWRNEQWEFSPSALKALGKRFLFPPAGWAEELDDGSSVRGRLRVGWAGAVMPGGGRVAFLLRAKVPKGRLPALTWQDQPLTVYPLGHDAGLRGWQPFLAVTGLPYPEGLLQGVLTSNAPLSRLLLTRLGVTEAPDPDPDPDPGDGGSGS
ncbi:hypothetical protein [Deinococcus apachensis]|uniref:hypothetical protein n=1 Tax=Deinococcus apachensis TaxID=309886 RepID=UPI0003667B05|nr:hypothetical protein [Deinococcus apachensis]